ncbi:MAG TPA: nickel-dependent lactate racemase [Gaiellaceae bacterium]|nr:nickel-dependent lactate racemase [Gaiellaceae bacterium]
MTRIALPYGGGEVTAEIVPERVEDVELLSLAEPELVSEPQSLVAEALADPIGSPRLRDLARGCGDAVIVVDDLTRPTPVSLVLPAVVDELLVAGVTSEAITVLVALGTHRPMTEAELADRLGGELLRSFRVVQHDYRDPNVLVELGVTPGGIPAVVNRLVLESGLVVAIGNIVPHRYCGWAGGAKMILPGVAGAESVAATHLMITKDPGIALGVLENRARQEIEAVADRTSLRFIVNTILTRSGGLHAVVAGGFRDAFRAGVGRALEIYAVGARRLADVVVTSGYPSEINFWQAGKALYAADLLVRDGGSIVIAAPCPEGMGEHDEFTELLGESYEEIETRLARGEVRDLIGAAAALAVAVVRRRAAILLVADGVGEEEAARAGLTKLPTLQAALEAALASSSAERPYVTVLREGAEALPVLEAPVVA